jgi:hydroxyethylthiazole kinase-like uncharacterized protein yjeF
MKILPVELIREADKYTIANEPIDSVDLMERAANSCIDWITEKYGNSAELCIFCGCGNNGGDGLAIARLWQLKGNVVSVFVLNHSKRRSLDFETNYKRLKEIQFPINEINTIEEFPNIDENIIIVDSILGSGLNNPLDGLIKDIVFKINSLKNQKIAIDIPTGLFADKANNQEDVIFKSDFTLSFELPKLAFLFPMNYQFVGNWVLLPINLKKVFINTLKVDNYLISNDLIKIVYKSRLKYAHKGNYGHALIIAGSYGKTGSAVLAAKACLRTGVGLLTVHCPSSAYNILQQSVPEAMFDSDLDKFIFTASNEFEKYDVIGIGPGLGLAKITQNAFFELIKNYNKPMLIDADAINILSINKSYIKYLPENSILTPHFKEFERLTHKVENDFERNDLQREFSIKNKVYIVLKGANTAITTPQGDCFFNNNGNPGMATAGSGDVLSGIITSLLSQSYNSFEACVLGVFLHGLAGDIYKSIISEESLIASDLIDNLGKAFSRIKLL